MTILNGGVEYNYMMGHTLAVNPIILKESSDHE